MPYICPQSIPTGFIARSLLIPNDTDIIAAVNGALLDLTQAWQWEQVPTSVSPDAIAPVMYTMWLEYLQSTSEKMIGQILPVITSAIPPNALLCDGATYLRADYPSLYDTLDAAFIVDADTFIVPDLRGRTIIGTGTGTAPNATAHTMNQMSGDETHTLTIAEMPNHAHFYTPPVFNIDLESPGTPDAFAAGIGLPTLTDDEGGSGEHNNMQPFTALKYMVIAK